jgi:protocatechuate 3,4-dioxygenase beta subunit
MPGTPPQAAGEHAMNRRGFSLGVAALPLAACTERVQAQAARLDAEAFYACEGCEGALERPAAGLSPQARIAPAGEPGETMLIRGVVRQADGRTPAPGVVIYAYHTNVEGLYAGGGPTEAARKHGRLRGWVRTGPDGRYAFQTVKPGVYPDRRGPAHVHLTAVEPRRRPVWLDSIVFRGEFGVTPAWAARQQNRGGGGIVQLRRTTDGALLAQRDIVLDRHPPTG